ncbi:MAG: hypothetical protein IKB42_04935 [Clostridia bacterium]|nr:hypothetical protein [Clostridia bacterium]
MDIFTVLKKNELILVDDTCENGKTRKIINQLNHNLADMMDLLKEFDAFKEEQMESDYRRKAVIAKTLLQQYMDWKPMVVAYTKMEKQERAKVDRFYLEKSKVLAGLNTLLRDCKKLPVVCAYDVFDGKFKKCPDGHPVIILGNNNTAILTTMLDNIENLLHVKGCLEEIDTTALSVNFVNVNTNVANCKQRLEEMYRDNPSKYEQLNESIARMEEIGKRAVIFSTYKDNLMEIGVTEKDINLFEKGLAKEYIPYKKQLKKAFEIEFVEINDLVVNEDLFATAGEKGFKETFKTYSSNEVKFITDEELAAQQAQTEPQEEPQAEEEQAPAPKPAGFRKLSSIDKFLNKSTDEAPAPQEPVQVPNSQGVEFEEVPAEELEDGVPTVEELQQDVEPAPQEPVEEKKVGRKKSRFGKAFDDAEGDGTNE